MGLTRKLSLILIALTCLFGAQAQRVNVKTNLLTDALLSPNVGVEVGLKPHWSLDMSGGFNLWTIDGHKWKHWYAQPEARYWFCEYFAKHFVGVHALGGQYNFGNLGGGFEFLGSDFRKLKDNRYQGWAVGGGIAYGYSFVLDRHWDIELEIGVGYLYTKFNKFECKNCGSKDPQGPFDHHYVGPTKAAVNLVYVF